MDFPDQRGVHLCLRGNIINQRKKFTHERELERENELLRAELAYLKKLRALGIDIPSRLRKQNYESSRTSEKNSD